MRTCIVTGANAGIGKSAAIELARKGARVILACRNRERAEAAAAEIRSVTGNGQVIAHRVDLALMADTRSFAREFAKEFGALDVLINNAADFDLSRKEPLFTAEGNEAQFATNLLAPFLLMQELLPYLDKSDDGRILNISSKGLMAYPNIAFDFGNVRAEKGYNASRAYYQTKLGLLMVSLAMARRLEDAGSNTKIYALRVPAVKVDIARYPGISSGMKALYRLKSRFALSPEEMAKAYAALTTGEKPGGFCYDEKLREVRCNKNAYDEAAQSRLCVLCGHMTG